MVKTPTLKKVYKRLGKFAYWRPIVVGLAFFAILFALSLVIPLPYKTFDEFVVLLRELYASYGYWVVFLGSIVEGLLIVSWYFPGSAMVLLAAAFAAEGVLSFSRVMALAIAGFTISYNFNYFLGRYGWYKLLSSVGAGKPVDEAKKRISKHGRRAIFLGMISPGLAVLFSTAAGILRFSYSSYFLTSFVALSFWTLLWGTLAFFIGLALIDFIQTYWWAWTIPLVSWFVWKFIRG